MKKILWLIFFGLTIIPLSGCVTGVAHPYPIYGGPPVLLHPHPHYYPNNHQVNPYLRNHPIIPSPHCK